MSLHNLSVPHLPDLPRAATASEDRLKRSNVPIEYSKEAKRYKKSKHKVKADTAAPNDLDWSHIFSNDRLRTIKKDFKHF